MIRSYTTIYFKDRKLNNIFNATLDNEFYSEGMVGKLKILEDEIPKRDIPYFYGTSRSPLEFEVIFAFNKPMDIYEIKSYVEFFAAQSEEYHPLAFEREDGFITPVYYVIAVDQLESEYIRTDINKYVGYFKIKFRANAPYGFEEDDIVLTNGYKLNLSNASLASQHLVLEITATKEINDPVKIENDLNGTLFKINKIYSDETITIDLRNLRLTTNLEDVKSVYERWDQNNRDIKKLLTLEPKINIFLISNSNVIVKLKYKIPRFI